MALDVSRPKNLTQMQAASTAPCIHCGAIILRTTFNRTDGFCMRCCDPCPRITGMKDLLGAVTEADVDAELAAQGVTTGVMFHRWQHIKSRTEPGDTLVRFTADLQKPGTPAASRDHLAAWSGESSC